MISLLYSLTYLFLISLALENGEKLKVFISFIRSASELPGEISGSIYTCCSPRLVNNFHHFSDGTLLRNSHRQCFKKKTSPSPADLSNRELITNSTTQKQKVGRDSSRCSFVGQRISLLITLIALRPTRVATTNRTNWFPRARQRNWPLFSFTSHMHLCGSVDHHCVSLAPMMRSVYHWRDPVAMTMNASLIICIN